MGKSDLIISVVAGLVLSIGMNVLIAMDFAAKYAGTELASILLVLLASMILTSTGAVIITLAISKYINRHKSALWEKFQIPE